VSVTANQRLVFGSAPPGVRCHPRPAAYAVIHGENGSVAAVSATVRGRLHYWLPGGGSEPGETPADTLVRELREELGRLVQRIEPIGAAVQFFYAGDKDRWYEMTAAIFRTEFVGEPFAAGEHELHWIDPRRFQKEFFHRSHVWAATQPDGDGTHA